MKTIGTCILTLALTAGLAGVAAAEVKVQLSDVHICCGACVRGIQKAVEGTTAKVDIDRDGGSVKIEAATEAEAQKVVDALAAAGFHGSSDHKTVVMKDVSGVPSGKVNRIQLGGIHNCCLGCTNAIKDAVKGVPGVQEDTLKNRETEFVVEGDFSAADVVKALTAAGFHVKVLK